MDLPLISALFVEFSITMYVLLDGFDLGVGTLLLLQPDEAVRDHMIDSITPTWDGNETWLIMAGVSLLAGFPIAYSILMPAFYLPVVIMLLSLGLRGVSFEFRTQIPRYRRRWDFVFGSGSAVAACMQGLILGGLLQGVTVHDNTFAGTVFDCLSPFAVLCAVTALSGYILLGSCWLYLKTTHETRYFGERAARLALFSFCTLLTLSLVTALVLQPGLREACSAHSLSLITALGLMMVAAVALFGSIGKRSELRPLLAGLALVAVAIAGLAILVFPNIIPFRMSIWSASASRLSHVFLLTGGVIVTPLVLAYSAFAYWVFRGKTPVKGWGL